MSKQPLELVIEDNFKKQVRSDKKIRSAYLLVHSEKLNIHLSTCAGIAGNTTVNPNQPVHLASVGKLFTSTLVGLLYQKGKLDFEDKISKYLDEEIMYKLHVYKGKDYSDEIQIRHLLKQTSGLNDVFYPLLEKMIGDKNFRPTTREAVIWSKKNLKPVAKPGIKHFYTDTNFYLLGFIIENVTHKKFHEVMHELIFKPLGMKEAYLFGFSDPSVKPKFPLAKLYLKGVDLTCVKGIHQIDYAGGSIVAPLEDFLKFMKALVQGKIVAHKTLNRMINDDISMGFPVLGFDYGYAVWKPKSIPLIMPKKYFCWGCVGATGAYMFYHPQTESYIMGTFNDFAYKAKALRFMFRKVIGELLKANNQR